MEEMNQPIEQEEVSGTPDEPKVLTRSRIRHLQDMPYDEYLKTPEWQQKRAQALRVAEYRCQVCNSSEKLNVHHRTYERRGIEALADLTVLCQACHEHFHNSQKMRGRYEQAMALFLLPDTSSPMTLESFTCQTETRKQAYKQAEDYIKDPQRSLLIMGESGVGKTYLAVSIAHAVIDADANLAYITEPALGKLAMMAVMVPSRSAIDFPTLLAWLCEVEILCIENIGKGLGENITAMITTFRMQTGKPTIFTTKSLSHIGDSFHRWLSDRTEVEYINLNEPGTMIKIPRDM